MVASRRPAPDTAVTLTDSEGRGTLIDPAGLKKILKAGMRPSNVTVSVKEGRQRAQYQGTERFLSMTIDLEPSWTIVDSAEASDRDVAIQVFGESLTEKIMEAEGYLYSRILHMQAKDGVTTYARNKTNPYVENGTDLNAALQAANGVLP